MDKSCVSMAKFYTCVIDLGSQTVWLLKLLLWQLLSTNKTNCGSLGNAAVVTNLE